MDAQRSKVAAALVAGTLLVGACGGGGDDDDASGDGDGGAAAEVGLATIQGVPDATYGVQSVAFDLDMTLTGLSEAPGAPADTPDQAALTATGGIDVAAGRVTVDIDLGEVLGASGAAPASAEGAVLKTVIDGESAYVNYGSLGAAYGLDSSNWARFTLEQFGQSLGGVAGQGTGQTNPATFIDLLRGVDSQDDIEVEGTEDLEGEQVTHVIANADVAAAVAAAPEDRRAALETQFQDLGLTEVPVHLWLADDDLPRRVEVIFEPNQVEALGGRGLTVDYRLHDYGQPVEVVVPDAGVVVDGSSLATGQTPTTGAG